MIIHTQNENTPVAQPEKSALTWYDMEAIDMQDGKITVTIDKGILREVSLSCLNSPKHAVQSLGGKLAKVAHIFDGNAKLEDCVGKDGRNPLANLLVDANGTVLYDSEVKNG